MLLTDILEQNAKTFPRRKALVMKTGYRTTALSYKEVYDLSVKIACLLEKHGVGKGDTVLICAPNSPYWVCIFWGVLLRGAVLVPLSVQSTESLIRTIAQQTGATILFKHIYLKQKLPSHLTLIDVEFIHDEVAELDPSHFRRARTTKHDVVEIMYTSGTTGEPKGVELSHRNIFFTVEVIDRLVPVGTDDRILSILPLSHIFEQTTGFLLPFKNGASIVYAHTPAAIRELMREYRITKMIAVPEFLELVMNAIEAKARDTGNEQLFRRLLSASAEIKVPLIKRLLFHSVHKQLGGALKTVASGGAPLDPELENKWHALGVDLLQGYGLTETAGVVSANTHTDRRLGSVGKILPGVRITIAPDGEIRVKGPNVFRGYFGNVAKTKEAFTKDGWFCTGDIGERDKDNFLFLKGRKRYMILGSGGQNVYPEDIEAELNKNPNVADSCVFGLSKQGGRVEIHTVLLLSDAQVEPQEVVEQANNKLSSYQKITGWSVWPHKDFPRSTTRKVKKEEVRTWLSQKTKFSTKTSDVKVKAARPLIGLLADITSVEEGSISGQTNIVRELNLDSLLRVELVARIEETFGVALDETVIVPATTVSDLEALIAKAKPVQKPRRKIWPRSWWAWDLRVVGLSLCLLAARVVMKLRVEGVEHVHSVSTPVVVMPNHISFFDSVAVAAALPYRLRKNISYAAAEDVLYEQFKSVAWLVELLFNAFPFPRKEGGRIKFGLEHIGWMLDQGYSAVVYPEGRMSENGRLQPLKRGAGFIAVEMGAPIVPVKIIGTDTIIPPGMLMPRRRSAVTVRFGKPLTFSRRDSHIKATKKIEEALRAL